MKITQKILTYIFGFVSGMTLTSLLITKTDNYKNYFPILLIIILFKFINYDNKDN